MKSLFFSFLFIQLAVLTVESFANAVNPFQIHSPSLIPNDAVCFQTIDESGIFLSAFPTNQIRFISKDANFSYSFSGIALSLQVDKGNNKTDFSKKIIPETGFSSTVVFFFEGMNAESQLIGVNQAGSPFVATPKASKEIQTCNYKQIYYTEIYPGIDLRFGDQNNQLKYEYFISPGFDHREILIRIEGANDFYINIHGKLEIVTDEGVIIVDAPLAEQEGKYVPASWVVEYRQLSIAIPVFDRNKNLRIHSLFQ